MTDVQDQPRLTTAEWHAVSIALRDSQQGSCAERSEGESLFGRWFRALTGIEPLRPLADPKLDAVRRFVCASRRNVSRARVIASELMAYGYSREQIETLRTVAA